jgi:hypothetical protein
MTERDGNSWPAYYDVTVDRPAWETTRIAIERFAAKDAALGAAPRTEPRVAVDLGCGAGEALVARCHLVNANLSLPFLGADGWAHVWGQIRGAVVPGGRIAAMLFGDRDATFSPEMTCPPETEIRTLLDGFEIEHWTELEEEGETALGEPHHFHRFDVVARRIA